MFVFTLLCLFLCAILLLYNNDVGNFISYKMKYWQFGRLLETMLSGGWLPPKHDSDSCIVYNN